MKTDPLRTIVLLGYLAPPASPVKLDYLEPLDAELRKHGYRLLLVDQAGTPLDTACESETLPAEVVRGRTLDDGLLWEIERKPGLKHAVDMEAGFRKIDWDLAAQRTIGVAGFMRDLLLRERAVLCILWHQFNGYCTALATLCEDLALPVVFTHLGTLPRTIVFEVGGQMAESWVARESNRFLNLPVTDSELENARAYLATVRAERADRKPQTEEWSIRDRVAKHRDQGRKIVFYAGQNDYRAGILPATLPHARLHSPLYTDTREALIHLAELAEDHDWAVLFKPHPNVQKEYEAEVASYPGRIETVIGANVFECIYESDATATIVSQVSYLALIHGRPLVLLGNIPLGGKGCAYEVADRSEVARAVEQAISEGFTAAQNLAWERHVAQLLKYYLFAIDQSTLDCVGRGCDEAARFLICQARLPSPAS